MKLFRLAPALLLFFVAACFAQNDVASIKKAIAEKFPEAGGNIEVTKTTFGWYEVFAGGRLFYTDEKRDLFLSRQYCRCEIHVEHHCAAAAKVNGNQVRVTAAGLRDQNR